MNFDKGTIVTISSDIWCNQVAAGKQATYIGCTENDGWLLFTADGTAERESYTLPVDYQEWNHETEPWPGKPCGSRSKNPIFQLEDGTTIKGSECCWEPMDQGLRQQVTEEQKRMMQKIEQGMRKA